MKKLIGTLATLSILGLASVAFAAPTTPTKGEFGNHCAMGLTTGKQVATDCSINWSNAGKTYCFSSEAMKNEFAKNTTANLEKAAAEFAKVSSSSTGATTATTTTTTH